MEHRYLLIIGYLPLMIELWKDITNYYATIGESYEVNPLIFVGIHVIATPLFVAAVAWIIRNHRQKKSIVWPIIVSVFIFNVANIYLVIFGKNIPWWIYAILATTTVISGYFSYRKVRRRMG